MAYTALYDGEVRGAWSVPKSEHAKCRECDEEMIVVSKSVDNKARHFRHYRPDKLGKGGGGGGGGCSGGESDDHKKWKNFAAERLNEVFGDRAAARASVEEPLAAPWSDKEGRAADACLFFDHWDNQFGRGIAIEVQHKHKDKDKHAVEMDYNRQGVAVLWLSGEDFHSDGLRMREVDIRHQTREQTSICDLSDKWTRVLDADNRSAGTYVEQPTTHTHWIYDVHDPRDMNKSVPAKIPAEFFDQVSQNIWREQNWIDLFPDWNSYSTDTVELPPYPRSRVKIDIDIAHMLPEKMWKKHWKRGKHFKKPFEDTYVCSACDAYIARPDHPEPNWKHFRLHVKSNHKVLLGRATDPSSGINRVEDVYSQLLKEKL